MHDALAVIADSGAQSVVPVALAHAGWVGIELRRRLGHARTRPRPRGLDRERGARSVSQRRSRTCARTPTGTTPWPPCCSSGRPASPTPTSPATSPTWAPRPERCGTGRRARSKAPTRATAARCERSRARARAAGPAPGAVGGRHVLLRGPPGLRGGAPVVSRRRRCRRARTSRSSRRRGRRRTRSSGSPRASVDVSPTGASPDEARALGRRAARSQSAPPLSRLARAYAARRSGIWPATVAAAPPSANCR